MCEYDLASLSIIVLYNSDDLSEDKSIYFALVIGIGLSIKSSCLNSEK